VQQSAEEGGVGDSDVVTDGYKVARKCGPFKDSEKLL